MLFGGRGFEMFDDLDDLEDDPNAYPVAPLPRHERTWRHPSEMGEAAWVRTEPPVAIGRGLLVTSGAIGSALGVAVLYLMLPTGAGTPSAGPAVTSSFATERAAVVTLADEGTTSSFVSEPAASVGWTDSPDLTLPAPDTPSTVLVMADPESDTGPVSVAVSIEGSPYMVTTANALTSLDVAGGGVHLLGPGGPDEVSPLGAELLSIEGDLAFLSPAAGAGRMEVVSFAGIAAAEPGQPVTVLADVPEVVPYASGDAIPELDPGLIVEGTPVVDADGALVALCTVVIDADGAYVDMVPLAPAPGTSDGSEEATDSSEPESPTPATSVDPTSPDATTATTAPSGNSSTSGNSGSSGSSSNGGTPATPGTPSDSPATTSAGGWIGLRFDGAPAAAPLTVTGVVAGSPALAAGVMVGERLVAVDGVTVATVDDVIAAVKKRLPGDVVRLTLAPRATSTSTGPSTSTAPGVSSATTPTTSAPGTTTTTTAPSTTTTVAPAGGTAAGAPTGPATPASAASNGGSTSAATPAGTRTVSVVLGSLAPTV